MKYASIISLFFFFILTSSLKSQTNSSPTLHPDSYDDYNYALYVKLGSFGPGIEAAAHKSWYLNPRLGVTYFPQLKYTKTLSAYDMDATAKVRLGTVSFVNDFRVGNFFVNGGVFYNYTRYDVHTESNRSYYINNYEITKEKIGEVDLTIKPKKFAFYTGLGIGNLFKWHSSMTHLEAGLLFNRPYDVDLKATNMVSPTASQKSMIEEHLNEAKMSLIITFKLIGILRR